MNQDIKRLLKIKVDALKRLEKDYTLYKQEEISQYQKVERFKSDPTKDIYDVKKQEEILDETKRMIIDSVSRVTSYIVSLGEFLDEHKDKDDGSEIWIESYEIVDRLSTKFLNEQ
ncbi:hypothetical protein DICPUDRAFT_80741 [Dictyostelium purpureum]|uniref:Tubulin-specific chaperone A n=1 Tax=Dictyostelium purpureum TaxID=5786 RepID=F0ZRD9_DICPU|nr:uncharacterized protein DICPUDRAFT_80741 [Dictyostelium purpureum]EGC33497.1 hypothetical protein DICPUDRAFT_80741 [Dictyostelium purpureum]|eukprot:XP_003289971.1 hypothetical protein DICPUDRAFT_80741 [Dictyostelium purpureum]